MASVCGRILPAVGKRFVLQPRFSNQVRNFFDPWARSELRAIMRDMDRFQRDFMRIPTSALPRMFPVDVANLPLTGDDGSYRIDVDLSGFKPGEIQVNLDESDRVLTINAKCDRKHRDGSRFMQEISKKISIPEAVDVSQLKSFLHRDGVLAIEAPFKEQPREQNSEPRQIPVGRAGTTTSIGEGDNSESTGKISA